MKAFFPLTSTFFGLTVAYKRPLWEEIYITMKHLEISYGDVLMMPTCERRFFLGLATKTAIEREEYMEEMKKNAQNRNAKGSRSTTVSGEALKNKMRSGNIPLT